MRFPATACFRRRPICRGSPTAGGFEVLLAQCHHWFGLLGLVAMRAGLQALIAASMFLLLRAGWGGFWKPWALALIGMWVMRHCLGLQPMLWTILLFTVEIGLIFEARRREEIDLLYPLPVLFVLWANLHIQFVYGLFILGLLVAVAGIRAAVRVRWQDCWQPARELPLAGLLAVAGLSWVGTLLGPYSWRLYLVILNYLESLEPYRIITELQAMDFRLPEHFALLLIVTAAFFALGWQRCRDMFKLMLLLACTGIGFRMTRDAWFALIPALAIISDRAISQRHPARTTVRTLAMAGQPLLPPRPYSRCWSGMPNSPIPLWKLLWPAFSRWAPATISERDLFPAPSTTTSTGEVFSSGSCRSIRSPSTAEPISMEIRP
jgi:hypothetical protein